MTFAALIASTVLLAAAAGALAQEPSVRPAEWQAYVDRFVTEEGRVVDDANGDISHSEGQGYGLTLAFLAGDAATFERLWTFTRTELMLRDDGLAVWSWDPAADPHVTDVNNATDGDILIAHALALAGQGWGREDYGAAAQSLARAIGALAYRRNGQLLLPPGRAGYGEADRPDGPVINPSYWVYEAFPVLERLDPDTAWSEIAAGGLATLSASLTGPRNLPPEWVSIQTRARAAHGFAAEFGYNALRIPLYLARAGTGDPSLLARISQGMVEPDGRVGIVDLSTGEARETLSDKGYRIIPALAACVLEATVVPADLQVFEPSLYYPSTLHLLALSHLRLARPECLP